MSALALVWAAAFVVLLFGMWARARGSKTGLVLCLLVCIPLSVAEFYLVAPHLIDLGACR